MTVIPRKVKRKHGEYWELVDEKRVNGKIVQKYVGYLGKNPKSKTEVTYGDILPYVNRLMDLKITDADILSVLKKIGIDYDTSPITKIMLENDRKLKKVFLRLK